MIVLGLTGSIGMGKTTAARIFRQLGVPVFDADRCVHDLYEGAAVEPLASFFPTAILEGRVNRDELGALVLADAEGMSKLERVVHPLVHAQRLKFLDSMRSNGQPLIVVDVPLLFETGGSADVDAIIVVSASAFDQRERVLARPGMNEAKLDAILERQLPDAEKRRRAHFIVKTSCGVASARRQLITIIASVKNR
jgi:dephospho-CoA kinase